MDSVWEELHASRPWGKYPAEPLIRTVMRAYRTPEVRAKTRVLELGCGAGANLGFFLAEGFQTYGLDGAPSAILKAEQRLRSLAADGQALDLKVQTFEEIDYPPNSFDVVVDHFAIYANPMVVIDETYEKVHRMLAPGGRFYSCVWGARTTGANSGIMLEPSTSLSPTEGPCRDMGISHFFSRPNLEAAFLDWTDVQITHRLTEEAVGDCVEEFIVWAQK